MIENAIESLTSKNDKYACSIADQIISESQATNKWYAYINEFVGLLSHPKSLVRNRAINILATNARWDSANRYDAILPEFLTHITDDKPITARQCIKALAELGQAKPQYIPLILLTLQVADLSKYKDSMRPLIEKDVADTLCILQHRHNQ